MQTKKLLLASAALTIFSLSIILFQISCRKPATAQGSTNNCIGPQPKLQFKANGTLCKFEGFFDSKIGWLGTPVLWKSVVSNNYKLDCWGTIEDNDAGFQPSLMSTIGYFIFPNSVQQINQGSTYVCTSFDIGSNGVGCQDGNVSITISSLQNDYVSGTFSGTLILQNGSSVSLTDGVFTNVPILHRQ